MTDLTIEDELNLIKRKPVTTPPAAQAALPSTDPVPADPMAQLSTAWQDATKPAAKRAPKTPEEIDAELGLPPAETGLDATPEDEAGTWDVLSAAWRAETIKTDAWNDTEVRRRSLTEQMWKLLSEEGKKRVWDARGRNGWSSMEEMITAEAARQAAASPDVARVWAGLPLSIKDFNNQIDAGRRADLDEAQAVLDQSGGGAAEFLGTAARAITDETSVMLLPFGIGGSAWRTIAGEAFLGAAGEAAVLPKEYRVARELGLPDPDPASRIALGAVAGGAFSTAIIGIGKGYRALKSRADARRAGAEARPEGVDVIDHDADLDAAEAELRGDQTVQERLGGVDGGARAEQPADGTLGDILDDPAPGVLPPVTDEAPADWLRIRNGIFAGESGGDYNALFGYQNRKGGVFGNVKLTRMTVDQAIEFSSPRGRYGQWVKNKIGRVATPMGAYQIVGTTLRAAKKGLGLKGDEVMTPELQEMLGQWIYRQQGTGAWEGYRGPRDSFTPSPAERDAPIMGDTSRGYTGQGQVAVGDNTRIDVDYEVVDYASLIRAAGDLQPRDRSRIASDDWVAATAARLDPAQLMPSPTADRGTPIVGPDSVIESGNGRSMAIARAYERYPDRAAAYRGEIERAGFNIPEGMERPVLIARRRTELTADQRRRLVIDAQDSGVAQMTPTEVARATAQGMNPSILFRLDPTLPLTSEANGGFVRAALGTLPRSARNAMFDAGGGLNALGQRQLREAIFARAWPDPDILARYTEGAPAELKSLMEALEQSAPAFAALKADIESGLVAPEMDISGFVLDAMRLIGAARELASKEGMPIAKAVSELLDEVDLLAGPVAPLTAALVRKMWRSGRAAPANEVATFLTRYADEARKAGASGGMFEAPTPGDVLRTVDPETFADLPENYGQARGFATQATSEAAPDAVADRLGDDFDTGAQSPAAEAAHADIAAELRAPSKGASSPEVAAIDNEIKTGLRKEMFTPPDPAAVPTQDNYRADIQDWWSNKGSADIVTDDGKLYVRLEALEQFNEVLELVDTMVETGLPTPSQARLQKLRATEARRVAPGIWAYLRTKGDGATGAKSGTDAQPGRTSNDLTATDPPAAAAGQGVASAAPAGTSPAANPNMTVSRPSGEALDPFDTATLALDRARSDLAEFADLDIELADGTTARAGDILDDIDADRQADAVLQACGITQGGAQ